MTTYKLLDFLLPMVLIQNLAPVPIKPFVLLVMSLFIYSTSGWQGLCFMVIAASVTYVGAIYIDQQAEMEHATDKKSESGRTRREQLRRKRRRMLYAVLLICFGLLCALKYVPQMPYYIGLICERLFGIKVEWASFEIPLGVSFYTFALMGYLLDVYNRKYHAERNYIRLLLFTCYFPLLIQGPICRYNDLAPQLAKESSVPLEETSRGLLRILWGLFKKKVVADRAVILVNAIFKPQAAVGGTLGVVGVLFYSLQQYADFSGGIDIVLGISQMMGIYPTENFRQPYFATSLGDFWRRWHITLGSWMRDYVFYPFALSKPMQILSKTLKKRGRKTLSRTIPAALGNILVFAIVGLWHGRTSNFIAWGLYNGIILAISALAEPFLMKHRTNGHAWFKVIRTFIIVNIGWFFDRSASLGQALHMIGNIFTKPEIGQLFSGFFTRFSLKPTDYLILAVSVIIMFVISMIHEKGKRISTWLGQKSRVQRAVIVFLIFFGILWFAVPQTNTGFMYAMY
ncbi:MAG: MBOAT family protein [Clostridia bacterium]|nr:MBOAT family protein [Clostridia bacterium]